MHYLKVLVSVFTMTVLFQGAFAQTKLKLNHNAAKISNGSKMLTAPCSGTIKSGDIKSDWGVSFQKLQSNHHATTVPASVFKEMKEKAELRRVANNSHNDGSYVLNNS